MRKLATLAAWLCICAGTAQATDIVELTNGDRISGEIVDVKGGTLSIKTAYALPAGAPVINIDFSKVKSIESDTARRVVLGTGEVVEARFVRKPDGIFLESAELGGTKPVDLANIESVGVPEVRWTGAIGANVNGSAGNTKTFGYGIFGDAARETKRDSLRVGFRSVFAENQVEQNGKKKTETTQQFTLGRGRYDYFFTDHFFANVFVDFENDRFKDLNLRTRIGAGPGYRFIKTDTMLLQGMVGAAYVNENYRSSSDQKDQDYITAVGGEEFRWTIGEGQKLYQTLDIYPSLKSASDFILHFEAGYRQNIWGDFFMDIAFIDDFDNEPAEGRKSNDFKYLLGVGYNF